jgi:hypothetical protein
MLYRARIFKILRRPGIDSKESITPAGVLCSLAVQYENYFYSVPRPNRLIQIPAQYAGWDGLPLAVCNMEHKQKKTDLDDLFLAYNILGMGDFGNREERVKGVGRVRVPSQK